MENKGWKQTITYLIALFVSVGIGTFIYKVLERTEINVWLARGIGALVSVVICLVCYFIVKRKDEKTDE